MGIGYNIIKDAVERIDLAMGECSFSSEELEALKEIFAKAQHKTERVLRKVNESTNQNTQ